MTGMVLEGGEAVGARPEMRSKVKIGARSESGIDSK
jgi:hypothetical protein